MPCLTSNGTGTRRSGAALVAQGNATGACSQAPDFQDGAADAALSRGASGATGNSCAFPEGCQRSRSALVPLAWPTDKATRAQLERLASQACATVMARNSGAVTCTQNNTASYAKGIGCATASSQIPAAG
jgi:hypothetical protein